MPDNIQVDFRYNNRSKQLNDYIAMFGFSDLIPVRWFSSDKYKSIDEVYAESVRRGITWRKLTNWNEDRKKNILL